MGVHTSNGQDEMSVKRRPVYIYFFVFQWLYRFKHGIKDLGSGLWVWDMEEDTMCVDRIS